MIGFKPEIISFDEFMKATREINPTDYNYMVCVVTQPPFYFIFDPSQPIYMRAILPATSCKKTKKTFEMDKG